VARGEVALRGNKVQPIRPHLENPIA